jgi:general secretion pathway protein I
MKTNPIQTFLQKGFTLLEVIVALAILALTMTGLVTSIGNGANNQNALEERTFARWVTLNQIAKMQLGESVVQPGNSSGLEEMAGRQWEWQQTVEKTGDPLVRRVIVTAGREGQSSVLARSIGYLLVIDE